MKSPQESPSRKIRKSHKQSKCTQKNVKKSSQTLKNNTNIRSLLSAAIPLSHFYFRSPSAINPLLQLPLSLFLSTQLYLGLKGVSFFPQKGSFGSSSRLR